MDEQLKPNQIEAGTKSEEIWGGVTNPREHQENHFRYLVYAFNPYAAIGQRVVSAFAASQGLETTQRRTQANLLEKPEDITKRNVLSLSLIG